MAMAARETAAPRSILVRSVNWLGDAVMTTPALRRLRERFPDARITLLTREKLAGLWRDQPVVDQVMAIGPKESTWTVGRRLQRENFELAIILPNSLRSAFEAWVARIPARIGFGGAWRDWLLTRRVERPSGQVRMIKRTTADVRRRIRGDKPRQTWPLTAHHVHTYLVLVQAAGASAEILPPALVVNRETVREVVDKFGLGGAMPGARPLFGLNPGAEYGPAKRWPAERFIAAAREVQERTECVWLLTGGAGDVPAAQLIEQRLKAAGVPVRNLAGRTSLRELCALLSLCRVYLTNDTGPMHLAAAVGVSVVAPFGSTSPELTGPGLPGDPRHRLLTVNDVGCAPCFRRSCPIDFRCMQRLPVEQITRALLELAAPRRGGG